jgi:putative oxidoreductase
VSDAAAILVLIGRVVFGGYFVMMGLTFHVPKTKMAEQYAGSMGFPLPGIAGWPTGLWMGAGGLSLALGIWPDVGALMIAAFLILGAAWFHRWWTVEDPTQRQFQQGYFFRNVISVGAILIMFGFFATVGEGLRYSITAPLFTF